MAPRCTVCGADAATSDACPHCAAPVCPDHRVPAAHDCPGTDAGRSGGYRVDLDAHATVTTPEGEGGARLSSLLRPGLGLAVLTLVLVIVALGAVAYVGPLGGDLDPDRLATQIGERTDEARLARGVGATRHDATLAAVARRHSRDMRDRGYVGHTDPDGDGPQDRAAVAGLECRVGENIYQAPRGALATSEAALADHVVRAFLDSPGHRKTLLDPQFTRQGVGVAVGRNAVYVTQMFC